MIGGTSTTSTLTLKTTTGVGTTNADMIFVVGNNGATEAMRILNSGNVGIGDGTPAVKFTVQKTAEQARFMYDVNNYLSISVGSTGTATLNATGSLNAVVSGVLAVYQGAAGALPSGLHVEFSSGSATNLDQTYYNRNTTLYLNVTHNALSYDWGISGVGNKMTLAGGLTLGAPTGGAKGDGTLNATAVYDDNVILTDWVYDLAYDGRSEQLIPDGGRLYHLMETEETTRRERRLPWMPTRQAFESERSLGGMVSRLWFGQEQQQLYIQELAQRIVTLEAR